MAQYYTLDEAAQRLGLSTDEFRRKLATEWKQSPRRYPDGATLRFQAGEIDELARTLGGHSDADLQLADEPFRLADDHSSDDFVPLGGEDMIVHRDKPASSGKLKKSASDSDVRLDLAGGTVRPAAHPGHSTEDIDLDAEQRAKPPSSKKLRSPPQVTGEPAKPTDKGSDFDLSLTSDSSDEFELQLTDDSDEVDIGVLPGGKGIKAGDSGINLQAPADSGISLEKSSDFELALEGDTPKSGPRSGPRTPPRTGPKTGPKSGPKSGPKTGPQPVTGGGDESEFELTLDDNSVMGDATSAFPEAEQKDIFETDFELPALDDESGSEAVALEESDTDLESSDFDLAIDEGDAAAEEESGSQVVALEEDEAAAGDEDLDELEAADDLEAAEVRPARAPAAPAEWGILPGLVLIPCVAVMALVGLMSWELVHGMQNYQQPGKATGPIVRFFAESFGDGKLPAE
jgi:hypothetical protein